MRLYRLSVYTSLFGSLLLSISTLVSNLGSLKNNTDLEATGELDVFTYHSTSGSLKVVHLLIYNPTCMVGRMELSNGINNA